MGRKWLAGAVVAYGLVGLGMSMGGCTEAQARVVKRRVPLREIAAKIAGVEAAQKRVILDVQGELTVFSVTEETVFFKPGGQASLEELREGQAVRAIYEAGEAPAVLQWVELIAEGAPLPGAGR